MLRFCSQCATPLDVRPVEGKPRPVCPACGHVVFADPKVAATLLVERDGQILMLRRRIDPGRGRWCFPGGYVDFGEDPRCAAQRECWEEAGLHLEPLQLLDVSFDGRVIVITYHALAPAEALPVPGDDADQAAWFAPEQLPPLAFEGMRQAIAIWQRRRAERT